MKDIPAIVVVFYANNRLITERIPKVLQITFGLLAKLFDRIGLRTNDTKTKAIIFIPR